MAGNATKRISKELGALTTDPEPGIQVELADSSNLYDWLVTITAPDNSPYKGGTFKIKLHLPDNYPFKPPTLAFATKIYHPNVLQDETGTMCLGLLRPEEWKPACKIVDVLQFTRQLIGEPNPNDAVEQTIAREYKEDRATFEKKAKEYTAKYAK